MLHKVAQFDSRTQFFFSRGDNRRTRDSRGGDVRVSLLLFRAGELSSGVLFDT